MNTGRALSVLMPEIPGQRWSCHSCGQCCRTLVVHLTREECRRLDEQGWAIELGVEPYVRVGRNWALNKQADGACVFLDEANRCRIHSRFGEKAKPLACQVFPFSVRPVAEGWQASFRFDCPSALENKGEPISRHRSWLGDLVRQLEHGGSEKNSSVFLVRGVRAKPEEPPALVTHLLRWLREGSRPFMARLIGAARLTSLLHGAKLRRVRGPRFKELLDLLFTGLDGEAKTGPESPSSRQTGLLRQLAFAHAEHISVSALRSGLFAGIRRRTQQLRAAKSFLHGEGVIPTLPGITGTANFEEVDRVQLNQDDGGAVAELLQRYLLARIQGRSVFGAGYYGWPVVAGFGALWLSIAVAGWLARVKAAAEGRKTFTQKDAGTALGIVDRAATRLPALGSFAERTRLAYLFRDDGLARLMFEIAPIARALE